MIEVGVPAPGFALRDHFGRVLTLDRFRGRAHVMLLFYPLDFTPTCSEEAAAVERLLSRFRAAHTQVLGVSVDSEFCHANWGKELGGISFPLLADFHPKGAVATAYGLYLPQQGFADRATVIVDADGIVRYALSVTPSGRRDVGELAAACAEIHRCYGRDLPPLPEPAPLEPGTVLYVRGWTGRSRVALLARANLHLHDQLPVRNVRESAEALEELRQATGAEVTPCLLRAGRPTYEPRVIAARLAQAAAPLPGERPPS
ncbi:MAG: redoxin domain-containing protein [Armatimonadota bacterium]|nr:redoxin domain-containing protein [Armatimonadota bacterium]